MVISDGSDNDGNFFAVLDVSDDSGHGYRGSGSAGSLQSSEDGLGETGLTSSGEEGEELDEEMGVQVLGFSGSLVTLSEAASFD